MAKKERIGILSGRYDPVCSAHIRAALNVLESGSADRVLLILSGAAPAEDRWKMLVAAAADPQNAVVQLSATSAVIDKAASKGVIHKNAANRKKARLAKQLNKAANA